MISSLNFTRRCFENTCDFLLLTGRPDVVSDLIELFESDWQGRPWRSENRAGAVIVGPEDLRRRLSDIIESAETSIRIIDHKAADFEMLALLNRKRLQGVDVRILGAGELGGLWPHGKMLLVDNRFGVIGSASLSDQGLRKRREVAVRIDDPAMAAELGALFERCLAASPADVPAPQADGEDDDE